MLTRFVACLCASVLATSAAFAGTVPPLPADQKAVLDNAPTDAPAKELLGIKSYEGRHYLWGDEYNSHLWYPHVKNLGGAYAGIGSDQQYLFVGWARPEIAWLMDYDAWVIDLHAVYRAFFLSAESPDAFLKFWTDTNTAAALDRLDHFYAGTPKLEQYKKLFKANRHNIAVRLTWVKRSMTTQKTPCYLNDADTYGYVRGMIESGRLRPQLTNLLADKGLAGIAQSATKLGLKLHLLYLSNAEQYWPYSEQFRKNIRGLPMDDASRVIRTLSTFSINKDYRYNIQPGLLFQGWLEKPAAAHVHRMIPRRKLKDDKDIEFLVFDKPVPVAKAKK